MISDNNQIAIDHCHCLTRYDQWKNGDQNSLAKRQNAQVRREDCQNLSYKSYKDNHEDAISLSNTKRRKRTLVKKNVPKTTQIKIDHRCADYHHHHHNRCSNQRSRSFLNHDDSKNLGYQLKIRLKKLLKTTKPSNIIHNAHRDCYHRSSLVIASITTKNQSIRFFLANIALIYIVLTSILAVTNLFQQQQPQIIRLCSATHQRFVTTTNFYWPASISNQQHHPANFQSQQEIVNKRQKQAPRTISLRSNSSGGNRRSLSSSAAAAAAAAAAALATANAALARRGQSNNLMIGQNFNNFSSAVPYSVMMQDVDYSSSQEDPIINEPAAASIPQIDHQPWSSTSGSHISSHGDVIMDDRQKQKQKQNQQPQNTDFKNEHTEIMTESHDGHYKGQFDASSITMNNSASLIEALLQQGQRLMMANNNHDATTESSHSGTKQADDRALLPLDSNRLVLPQMQQIKARFNQGCVGGTKCQFFAFCWMSGGSLGASCGLLMTCCVTPSRQEIQPGFYGPVVNDPYCGRSTSKINRIVGGTDASFGQFPWQAFVQVGGSRCGGALISSRHVVTAGHCVARSQHSPSSIKVTLGDYILNSDIESIPHEVFSVVEVLLHPNFRFTPQADRYDVAVLELDRAASYKDNIKPICLPQKDATFVGRVAYVAGWGALQAGSKLRPKVLQHVAVPVIENHVCESWHRRKGIDIRIYDEMMCAGYELGQRDACQGDSGGPLMLNQFGVWYLVGIVSAGYSCAKQYQPGIYHRVSSSSDWISSNVYQQGSSK